MSVPKELDKLSLPTYVVEPPDILVIEVAADVTKEFPPVQGTFLVRPDGTVAVGAYGDIYVAGHSLPEVRDMVVQRLAERLKDVKPGDVFVDVYAYNSKVYYVVTDGGGAGAQLIRIPATGNETVLDALSQVGGLSVVSSKNHVWVARPTADPCRPQILPVDWKAIVECGSTTTNYQVLPGDRIYVDADPLISLDTFLAKVIQPWQRVIGAYFLTDIAVKRIEGNFGGGGFFGPGFGGGGGGGGGGVP